MDLKSYYDNIVNEIKSKKFKILELTDHAPEKISPHLEAINYIIYDWNRDHKDDRDLEFEYVILPEINMDLNSIKFEDFFDFLIKTKTDENILIEIKDIEIVNIIKNDEEETKIEEIKVNEIVKDELKIEDVNEIEDFLMGEKKEIRNIIIQTTEEINKDVDMDYWLSGS